MVKSLIGPSSSSGAPLRAYLEPVLRHSVWFGFFLVLAPIVVGPRGYGVFILALCGIAIAEALLAKTGSQALIDLPVVEELHLSTALVTLIAAGGAMSLMLYAATGAIGAMVDEATLGDMFRSLALLPLLGTLAAVPRALLRREGRYLPFIVAGAVGPAAGGSAAVALAWAGAGPWSLVAQIIVQRFVECGLLWGMAGARIGIAWSRRHFVELVGALDLRALRAAWPRVSRYGPCLLVGVTLGPTAAGLYMLASRVAGALTAIFLARRASLATAAVPEILQRTCSALLPAAVGSTLLAIALPPLIDLRWWGAVLPGQILLLGAVPASVIWLRAAYSENAADEARWQTVRILGGVVIVALAVPYGLVAVAAAEIAWTAAVAIGSLWPIGRALGKRWRAALFAAARPCGGALAAGLLLSAMAEPVGLRLDALPAFCLLTAGGWLCYLVIRGEPLGLELRGQDRALSLANTPVA